MASPLLAQRSTFVQNLCTLYRSASPAAKVTGLDWYQHARTIMHEWADTYSLPLSAVCCVTAALSPQISWERNLIIADDVLAGRPPSIGALRKNVEKAENLYRESGNVAILGPHYAMLSIFPTGRKVQSFACNLFGPSEAITVDTHGFQAAFNDPALDKTFHPSAYDIVAGCYRAAAWELDRSLEPCQIQAVIWCAWKERYPVLSKRQLRRKW